MTFLLNQDELRIELRSLCKKHDLKTVIKIDPFRGRATRYIRVPIQEPKLADFLIDNFKKRCISTNSYQLNFTKFIELLLQGVAF